MLTGGVWFSSGFSAKKYRIILLSLEQMSNLLLKMDWRAVTGFQNESLVWERVLIFILCQAKASGNLL